MTGKRLSPAADIDIFRGLAALVVVALHTREVTWIGFKDFWKIHGSHLDVGTILGYATFPVVWGSIGVPVFFVLSGYCIHRSQAVARHRDPAFRLAIGNFYLRRFLRIYPVLFGALLLTCACDWLSRQYLPNSGKLGDTGLAAFLTNLFSLQGVAGKPYGSNGALWTLSIEVQFYALYPLLLFAMARFGQIQTLFGLIALNVASYLFLERNGILVFSSYYVSWYLGALVAEADIRKAFERYLSSPGIRLAGIGLSCAVCGAGFILFFVDQFWAFQIWAIAFAGFLLVFLRRPAAFRGSAAGFFRWLGTFSFSIYIVHLPLVVLLQSLLFHSAKQAAIYPFYPIVAAAVGCAYVFSLLFEKPALALSKAAKPRMSIGERPPVAVTGR